MDENKAQLDRLQAYQLTQNQMDIWEGLYKKYDTSVEKIKKQWEEWGEDQKSKERKDKLITPVLKDLEEKLNSEFCSKFLCVYKEGIPT